MTRSRKRATKSRNAIIREMYDRLWEAYGPQHWWPAETPTEVVIGAILTQNTAWRNVERAIQNLKNANKLTWAALREVRKGSLAKLIRPAGTYRVKAARLKAFVKYVWEHHDGSLESLLIGDLEDVRRRLLRIVGIGPETADSIILYAGRRPSFVVDAYTKRIARRHFITEGKADYETVRCLFQSALGPDPVLYNEYHALLVELAKRHCRPQARCDGCPLADLPHDAGL